MHLVSISVVSVANTCMPKVQDLEFALSDLNILSLWSAQGVYGPSASLFCHPYF